MSHTIELTDEEVYDLLYAIDLATDDLAEMNKYEDEDDEDGADTIKNREEAGERLGVIYTRLSAFRLRLKEGR